MSADTRTATVPGSQVPLAQREAIVERFSSEDVVFHARLALGTGAINTLVWSHARAEGVLADLGVLNNAVAEDPATAAFLPGIDWHGIEALVRTMDNPPALPSTSPSV